MLKRRPVAEAAAVVTALAAVAAVTCTVLATESDSTHTRNFECSIDTEDVIVEVVASALLFDAVTCMLRGVCMHDSENAAAAAAVAGRDSCCDGSGGGALRAVVFELAGVGGSAGCEDDNEAGRLYAGRGGGGDLSDIDCDGVCAAMIAVAGEGERMDALPLGRGVDGGMFRYECCSRYVVIVKEW